MVKEQLHYLARWEKRRAYLCVLCVDLYAIGYDHRCHFPFDQDDFVIFYDQLYHWKKKKEG